jgi:hypothetical protein
LFHELVTNLLPFSRKARTWKQNLRKTISSIHDTIAGSRAGNVGWSPVRTSSVPLAEATVITAMVLRIQSRKINFF